MEYKLNEALESNNDKSFAIFIMDIEAMDRQYTEFFQACNYEVTEYQRGQRSIIERILNMAKKADLLVPDHND